MWRIVNDRNESWVIWRTLKNAKYFNDKIVSCDGNYHTPFKTIDEPLHCKAVQSLPAENNIWELANHFSKYFISKIEVIRQVLDTHFQQNTNYIHFGDITMLPTENCNSFSPATADEFRNVIIQADQSSDWHLAPYY